MVQLKNRTVLRKYGAKMSRINHNYIKINGYHYINVNDLSKNLQGMQNDCHWLTD